MARRKKSPLPIAPLSLNPSESDAGSEPKVVDRSIGAFVARMQEVRVRTDKLKKLDENIAAAESALATAKAEREQEGRNVRWLELHLRNDYPEAAFLLGGESPQGPKRRGRKPKAMAAKPASSEGAGLTVDQAEQVLAALGNTFSLGEFGKTIRSMFPGAGGKGAIRLLGNKVTSAGGKGMGSMFKKT